jgi:hypothetical protein
MMSIPLQHFAEVIEGTPQGAGTMVVVPAKSVDVNIDGKYEPIDIFGNEDLADEVRVDGVQGFRASGPGDANAYDLLKWLINSQDFTPSAGNIWEPKTFVTGIKLQGNASTTYLVWKGVKPLSGSWKIAGGKIQNWSIEFGCISMADPSTTPPAGLVISSTFPMSGWYRSGDAAAVFTWNGTQYKYRETTVAVGRNMDRVMAGGSDDPFTQAPIGREINIQIKALWNDLTLYTDWKNQTKRTVSLGVTSGKTVASGTNKGLLKKCGIPIDGSSNEVQPQSWDIRLFTASA